MCVVLIASASRAHALVGSRMLQSGARFHFDYYVPSMLTVLAIFAGGWVEPYQSCNAESGAAITRAYMMLALIIGFLITLNVFIAILLGSFDDEADDASKPDDDGEGSRVDDDRESLMEKQTTACDPLTMDPVQYGYCFHALFLFGMSKKQAGTCRHWALTVVTSRLFERIIIFAIVVSTVCLAFDTPR